MSFPCPLYWKLLIDYVGADSVVGTTSVIIDLIGYGTANRIRIAPKVLEAGADAAILNVTDILGSHAHPEGQFAAAHGTVQSCLPEVGNESIVHTYLLAGSSESNRVPS